MKFYDRTKELALFADIYTKSQQEAQMTVLVGRRRIGKTSLSPKAIRLHWLSTSFRIGYVSIHPFLARCRENGIWQKVRVR